MSFLDNNHPNWRQFIDTFSSDVFLFANRDFVLKSVGTSVHCEAST